MAEFHLDRAALARLRVAGEAGVREAAEQLLSRSLREVPVATGALRDSAYVTTDGPTGEVGYTDPKAPAAHENLTVDYRNGRRAKFLEGPLNEMRAEFPRMMAAHLRRVAD